MSQGVKGSRHPVALADFEPALAKRIHSAWKDSEVTSTDLERRFHFSKQTMIDLAKCLGPRDRCRTAPMYGTEFQARLRRQRNE